MMAVHRQHRVAELAERKRDMARSAIAAAMPAKSLAFAPALMLY